MTPVSPGQAARILSNLVDRLTDTRQLRRGYAFEVRKRAGILAGRRPTPQARMAASGLRVSKGGTVLGRPGARVTSSSGHTVRLGGIAFGAEFGSNVHSQFAPRNERGYFLNPAAEQVDDRPGEIFIDNAMNAALRSRGLR